MTGLVEVLPGEAAYAQLRAAARLSIAASSQFRGLCPASMALMHKHLNGAAA